MDEKTAETSGHQHLVDFAESRPRDEHGHFIHSATPTPPSEHSSSAQLVDALIPHGVEVDHKVTQDDLLDVHLGNPLRKITALLEDIKKQKAFTFDLKGSLGMAGIVLVLGTFGIFGGTHALCSKGVQSQIGVLRILNYVDAPDTSILSRLTTIWDLATGKNSHPVASSRLVLIDGSRVMRVVGLEGSGLIGQKVITTGDYDSCSMTLTVKTPQSVEKY